MLDQRHKRSGHQLPSGIDSVMTLFLHPSEGKGRAFAGLMSAMVSITEVTKEVHQKKVAAVQHALHHFERHNVWLNCAPALSIGRPLTSYLQSTDGTVRGNGTGS